MRAFAICLFLFLAGYGMLRAQRGTPVEIKIAGEGKPISPDLFGIFFEDLSYAADGGLYAELVQNRSFEYTSADLKGWNGLTAWDLMVPDKAKAAIAVETAEPLNHRNPHYAVLTIDEPATGIAVRNSGFDGMAVRSGERYNLSLFARTLKGHPAPWIARLETKNRGVLGSASFNVSGTAWQRYTASIPVSRTAQDARLALVQSKPGVTALDVVSLFPEHTFHGHPNGMRTDLGETIAALKPKFMRFPGGCLVHGDGLANMYRWKETIGPVESRREQPNIWNYHQSVGLGYFEHFQFAEDIGSTPLPVVAAAVSCQNTGARVTGKYGVGQQALALADLPPIYAGRVGSDRVREWPGNIGLGRKTSGGRASRSVPSPVSRRRQ